MTGDTLPALKKCTKCGELKPRDVSSFPARPKWSRDGLASWCRECSCAHWRRANKKYRLDPSVRERARINRRLQSQTEEARAKRRIRDKRRRQVPSVWINRRIRNGIILSIHGNTKRRWQLLLGYSTEQLMIHLERQFTQGMSWDNMKEWHIDHIVPLASFHFDTDDSPEFRAAWALTNLRPLWVSENLAKASKRTLLL